MPNAPSCIQVVREVMNTILPQAMPLCATDIPIMATSISIWDGRKTIQVNWGNSEGGRVKVGITTSNGKYATDERCIQVIEQPKISVMSTPGYTVSTGTKVINLCFGETVSFTDISQSYDIPIESYTWIVEGEESDDNNEVVNNKNYSMTPLNPGKYTRRRSLRDCRW